MFNKKQKTNAFTLIELMVVIALIWIIALWANNITFKNLSDRQRLDWFFYQIKTNFETVQNNALIWKAIKLPDNSIIVPDKWEIQLNNSSSWIIQTYYYSWVTQRPFNENDIITDNYYSINTECENLNWTVNSSLTDTWSLFIEWWKLNFTWSILNCDSTQKVLRITTKYKNFEKVFTINTISWVIEEQ